jgi:replicative superfamily II helicase
MRASRIKRMDVLRISGRKCRIGKDRTVQSVLLQRDSRVHLRLGALENHAIKNSVTSESIQPLSEP